jgi:hypothetical protein
LEEGCVHRSAHGLMGEVNDLLPPHLKQRARPQAQNVGDSGPVAGVFVLFLFDRG